MNRAVSCSGRASGRRGQCSGRGRVLCPGPAAEPPTHSGAGTQLGPAAEEQGPEETQQGSPTLAGPGWPHSLAWLGRLQTLGSLK